MMVAEEGRIVVSGSNFEEAEKAILDNLIKSYKHKISEKIQFKEISLRIKKSEHGKTFLHEVQGKMIADKVYSAEVTEYNLFSAVDSVLDKLLNEAIHHQRTRRQ